jgi:Nif-specific regulatory protein
MEKLPQLGGGRYQLGPPLGRGGQGRVHRARDLATGADVAVKLGAPGSGDDLEAEFLTATALQHPAWPAALDLLPGERPALVLELVRGTSPDGARLPAEMIARLSVRLLLALRALHHRGLLHGDLKPGNMLLPEGPPLPAAASARLLDLGLARSFHRADGRTLSGTPAYLAPEARAGGELDERADLYSLGLTLACLLSGESDPVAARQAIDAEGGPLERWLDTLLADRKEQRPAQADAAIERGVELGALEAPPAPARLLAPPPALTGSAAAVLVEAIDRARAGGRPIALLGGSSLGAHRRLLDHLTARSLSTGGRRFFGRDPNELALRLAAERGRPAAEAGGLGSEARQLVDAGARPLVIALDLSHAGTVEEAAGLAGDAPEGSVVVLASSRPSHLDELERRLAEREPARADETRLGTEEVIDWLSAVLGSEAPAAGELARALRRAAGGEPDALARGLEAVVAGGSLACDAGGRWRAGDLESLESTARAAAAPEAPPPARLIPLLALGAWTREDFALDAAAAAAGLDPLTVQEARASGRLAPNAAGRLQPVSPAAAARALHALSKEERRGLSASLLDATGLDLPAVVRARALDAAGEDAEAALAWEQAGGESLGSGRASEAVERLQAARAAAERAGVAIENAAGLESAARLGRALLATGETREARDWLESLASRAADAPGRAVAPLFAALAEACEQSGDETSARNHARQGLERLGSRGSRSARSRLHVLLGRLAAKARDAESARSELESARELASGDEGLLALAFVERAHAELLLGDEAAAAEAAETGRRHARAVGDDSLRGRALQVLSRSAAGSGDDERAAELVEEAVALHRSAGDLLWEMNALAWLATLHGRSRRADKAAEAHRRVLALARRIGEPAYEASTLYYLGVHARHEGDWSESEDQLGAAAGAWRELGRPDHEAMARHALGHLFFDQGRLDEAHEEYEAVGRLLAEDAALQPLLERSRAGLALERGDAAEAADRARASLEMHEARDQTEGVAECRRILAGALLLRGHADEAHREADRAVRLAADARPRVRALALEARARTRAALPLTSPDAVPDERGATGARSSRRDRAVDRDFQLALELHEETGSPFDAARTRLAQARVLLASGRARLRGRDSTELQRALVDAAETFERLGATTSAKEARGLLERAEAGSDEDTRTLTTLYEVTRVLNSSLDRHEVLERALDLLLPTLDVERAALILAEPGADGEEELRVAASRGVDDDTSADALTYSRTVVFDVQGRGEPLVSPDAVSDPRFSRSLSVVRHAIRSLACVPLRVGEGVRGAVYVDDRRALRRFSDEDVRFLQAFADVAGPAIENARLVQELTESRDRLQAETLDLRQQVRERYRFQGMVGESAAIERVYEAVQLVADSTASVLVTGENGVGKELVARAVHEAGRRKDGPFVALNCAALPETLLEAELFGIEKGTATGVTGKIGKFEQADGGTLFLDEIGDMSIGMQARLLRVLQEKSFMRVGGDRLITVDVHVVAATNRNLEEAVAERTFREDLYYRLNVVPILVPSLRERREDVPLLLDHFTAEFAKELPPGPDGRPAAPPQFTAAVRDLLAQADWPGNIRQLRNLVHRLVLLCAGRRVEVEDLPPEMRGAREELLVASGREEATMDEIKRRYAKLMLERCGGNKRKTARTLGIAFKTLQGYLGE